MLHERSGQTPLNPARPESHLASCIVRASPRSPRSRKPLPGHLNYMYGVVCRTTIGHLYLGSALLWGGTWLSGSGSKHSPEFRNGRLLRRHTADESTLSSIRRLAEI